MSWMCNRFLYTVNNCVLYLHSMCFILHGNCVNLAETQKCVNFLHKFTNWYVYFVYNTVYHSKTKICVVN